MTIKKYFRQLPKTDTITKDHVYEHVSFKLAWNTYQTLVDLDRMPYMRENIEAIETENLAIARVLGIEAEYLADCSLLDITYLK